VKELLLWRSTQRALLLTDLTESSVVVCAHQHVQKTAGSRFEDLRGALDGGMLLQQTWHPTLASSQPRSSHPGWVVEM